MVVCCIQYKLMIYTFVIYTIGSGGTNPPGFMYYNPYMFGAYGYPTGAGASAQTYGFQSTTPREASSPVRGGSGVHGVPAPVLGSPVVPKAARTTSQIEGKKKKKVFKFYLLVCRII